MLGLRLGSFELRAGGFDVVRVLLAMRSRAGDASVVAKRPLLITLFFEGEILGSQRYVTVELMDLVRKRNRVAKYCECNL